MKLNFDELENYIENSLQTTLTSDSILINPNHFPTTHSIIQKIHHSQLNLNSDTQEQSDIFRKLNPKTNPNVQPQSHHFISDNLTSFEQKRFAHLKTIQEIQSFIKALENKRSSLASFNHKVQNISLNQKKGNISKLKQNKNKRMQDQRVSQRLYSTAQRGNCGSKPFCGRKTCKGIISTVERKLAEELNNFTGQPERYYPRNLNGYGKLYRSMDISLDSLRDSATESSSRLNNNVHQRLYYDWKVRRSQRVRLESEFDRKYVQLSKSLEQKRTSHSQEYEFSTQYRGFYERLESLVKWYNNKGQIYNQIHYLSSNTKSLSRSNKNKLRSHSLNKITQLKREMSQKMSLLSRKKPQCSKAQCYQNQNQNKSNQQINSYSQTFKPSEKNIQIIQNHEKKILRKLKGFFFDKKRQKIRINSDKIFRLSEREFGILYDLIRKVQRKQSQIKGEKKLEGLIFNFYQNLSFADKQQLKRADILSSCRIKNRKYKKGPQLCMNKMENLGSQGMNSKEWDRMRIRKDNSVMGRQAYFDPEKDYCAKLAQFV